MTAKILPPALIDPRLKLIFDAAFEHGESSDPDFTNGDLQILVNVLAENAPEPVIEAALREFKAFVFSNESFECALEDVFEDKNSFDGGLLDEILQEMQEQVKNWEFTPDNEIVALKLIAQAMWDRVDEKTRRVIMNDGDILSNLESSNGDEAEEWQARLAAMEAYDVIEDVRTNLPKVRPL